MALKPLCVVDRTLLQSDWMTASAVIREGMTIGYSSGTLQEVTGTAVVGIAAESRTASAVANTMKIPYYPIGCQGTVPVLCSATLSKGAEVKPATDGVAAATVGSATTRLFLVGTLLEAGVAGELAGCNIAIGGPTVGS